MLNLKFIYEDAIQSLRDGGDVLQIPSLPTSVFLMQQDLINHYKYAIYHYFNLTLEEHFLQNSSLGTPYQKWREITNGDFKMLFFSIKTLTRFTSRLYHESVLKKREIYGDFETFKVDSNRYTHLICDFKYQGGILGIVVNENETLTISSVATEAIKLDDGHWTSVSLKEVDISDRSILSQIKEEVLSEISELEKLVTIYVGECKKYNVDKELLSPYENMHESFWV